MMHKVEYVCAKNGIATNLFKATLECFMRMPTTTPQTALQLLRSVHEMAQNGIDFVPLLNAGVVLGMSHDYSRFKSTKRQCIAHRKKNQQLRTELITMRDRLIDKKYKAEVLESESNPTLKVKIPIKEILFYKNWVVRSRQQGGWYHDAEIHWASTSDAFRRIAGKFAPGTNILNKDLDIEAAFDGLISQYCDWHIGLIKQILALDTTLWKIYRPSISHELGNVVLSIKPANTKPLMISLKNDPFLRRTPFKTTAIVLDGTTQGKDENLSFISIYQKCLFDHRSFRIKTELEHLFAVRNSRFPSANELEALRMRFYKVIRKAYPAEMTKLSESLEEPRLPRYLIGPEIHVHEKPNVFFLKSRPYTKKEDSCDDRNPYIIGKLCYDVEKKSYCLMPGSRLNINEQNSSRLPKTMDEIYQKSRTSRSLVQKRVNIPGKISPSNPNEPVPQLTISFVHRKIMVPSASFAAQMVLGYKRNGLDCWKNAQGQTLREYLSSIGHSPARKVTPKSASDFPEDQEEHHSDGGSTTPVLR